VIVNHTKFGKYFFLLLQCSDIGFWWREWHPARKSSRASNPQTFFWRPSADVA